MFSSIYPVFQGHLDLEIGPNKTWCEVMEKDCQIRQMCQEDAMDCRKWRKLIKDIV